MINGLSNYLLCFLIIFSNIATVVYVYPLLLEYLIIYELKDEFSLNSLCFYLGILFSSYEISKLLGTYIWTKLSIHMGYSICINISLFSLAVLNFLLSFTKGFYSALVVRIITGLFNNISCLSKVYFYDFFPGEEKDKVIPISSISANFSTVIGFMFGGLIPTSNDIILYDNVGGFSLGLNKFFISCWMMSAFNIIALVVNIIKFKCNFTKSRPSIVRENVDIQIKDGQKEKEKDNISLSSIGSIKKPSLVLFDTTNRKDTIEKSNNNNIDQIIDKDDNIEDYSSRRNESLGGNKVQNDSSMRQQNKEVESKPNQYNNIIINNNININYTDHSKNYIQIQNNPNNESKLNSSNINTNNNIVFTNVDGIKASSRHINPSATESYNNIVHSKLIFTIENNIPPTIKLDDNMKTPSNSNIIVNNSFNSAKFQEIVISERHKNKKVSQAPAEKPLTNRQEGYSNAFNKSKKSKNLISTLNVDETAFKISIIYTCIQISESIIYNLFFCSLFAKSTFSFDYKQISYIFILLHLFYAVIIPILNKYLIENFNRKEKAFISKYLKGLIISSFFLTILFPIFFIYQPLGVTTDLLITSIFFFLRNLTISLALTSYNSLVVRLDNNKIKSRINTFHTYITTSLKAILCFLLYITCNIFLEKDLNYNFLVCGLAGFLFFLSLCFTSPLEKET